MLKNGNIYRYQIFGIEYLTVFNMAEAHMCITEERLKILIKSIFAEEF